MQMVCSVRSHSMLVFRLNAWEKRHSATVSIAPQTPAPFVNTAPPMQTLCKRVEAFLPELFVFVTIPGVPAHNNLAERSVRPLVVARKISGGTRSPKGSQTGMGLASPFGTWSAQHLNPFHQCLTTLSIKSSLGQV